jgi:hypothetical protein
MVARPIELGEIEKYNALAEAHGGLFDRAPWAALHGDSLVRVGIFDAGVHLRGGFCMMRERRFGLTVLRVPPFTPHIGPFFESRASNAASRTNEWRDIMEAMAEFLDRCGAAVVMLNLSLEVKDTLPFYWRQFKVVPRYTYRIDLRASEAAIRASMSPERRHDITKAQRDGIKAVELRGAAEIRPLIAASLARQGIRNAGHLLDKLLSLFPPGPRSFGTLAVAGGKPLAGNLIVHDERAAYYMVGGYGDEGRHHGAGALAMYRSIVRAKEMGLEVFDFEGSVVPSIERFFRGFGGTLTPYSCVNKAWLPLEMAIKLVKRSHF